MPAGKGFADIVFEPNRNCNLPALIVELKWGHSAEEIEAAKTLHDARWLDVNDVKYQEIVVTLRKVFSTYLYERNGINDKLKNLCIQELKNRNLLSDSIDKSLVEVLYYEQKFSRKG